jgi:hypothetical protein
MPSEPFQVKDCALITIASGRRAQSLREMRDHISVAPRSCIYHHFWGARLETRFEQPEYSNDFAAWARHDLHDRTLAERLSSLDPTSFPDLEAARQELVDIMDERLDEAGPYAMAPGDRQFEFLRSQIVVFDSQRVCHSAHDLAEVLGHVSAGSIFYHFIDARRRREDRLDDFRAWLQQLGGQEPLIETLAAVDPYFSTLTELRDELSHVMRACLGVP